MPVMDARYVLDSAKNDWTAKAVNYELRCKRRAADLSQASPAVAAALAGRTGVGVLVAVIDSGWAPRLVEHRVHRGFTVHAREAAARCGVEKGAEDLLGHGTECTDAIMRLAPDASVLPLRVFVRQIECDPASLAMAIDVARASGAAVINMSLSTVEPAARDLMERACREAAEAGCVLVAAGFGGGAAGFPAAFDSVVGVDSGSFATPYQFRYNAGECLQVVADGVGRVVRGRDGVLRIRSGTSIAAASVSGMIASRLEGEPRDRLDAAVKFLRTCGIPG